MSIVQYKCPNCGGPLEFNAQNQTFNCEFCLSVFNEEQLKVAFPDNENNPLDKEDKEVNTDDFTENTSLYSCPNCGAEIMSEDTTSATFCYYCHSPVILSGRLSGKYKPSKVIPFKYDKEAAVNYFKEWCRKKWFLPKGFYSQDQIEKLSGVYLPFWLADCKVDAAADAVGKKIRTWTSGDYRYTETKEYAVRRSTFIDFEGIPADGSSKTDDKLMEAIEPFDYSGLKDFSMSYLSGYLAEKYDVDNIAVFPRVRERVSSASEQMLRDSMIGYDTVSIAYSKTDVIKTDWHYMLLPVWLMTYKFKDKNYFFSLNGQTGKMAGIPPLSIARMLLFSGLIALVTFFIALLGGYFIW
ncbi:MAG TPA: hypothetical protein PKI60_04470 [Oscillospiraceae bacterium]|nr:hypothetical protein [Oscillospiraceae bacterium]